MMSEKKEKKDLVLSEQTVPAQILTKTQQLALLSAEQQLAEIKAGQAIQRDLFGIALRATSDRDWDDIGKKPRLNARGAKKIAKLCHLRVETFGSQCVEREIDEKGEITYLAYECKGLVTSPWGPPMSCSGRVDSDNQFHTTRYDKFKRRFKLKPSEVNRSNLAQQAQTLCVTRGVTQYMGLEKLDWPDIRGVSSAKSGKTKVQFKTKKKDDQIETWDPIDAVTALKKDHWDNFVVLCRANNFEPEQYWAQIFAQATGQDYHGDSGNWSQTQIANFVGALDVLLYSDK